MVGIVAAAASREKVASLVNSAKFSRDVPSKLEQLRQLKDELSFADSGLLSEFLPSILDLHADRFSPVRKFITEIFGDIGLKYMEFIPEIIPVLITLLKDGTPAVARQAITCGIELFRSSIYEVAIQGLYSSELDNSLESSWAWMVKFRDEMYSIAFQVSSNSSDMVRLFRLCTLSDSLSQHDAKPGSDGRTLLALKFLEAVILLYTPDPSGSAEPPPHQAPEEFNISWLRGGHPVLNVGDLSIEASQILGLLLDQLRFPTVKSVSNSMTILLINSLSAIAVKRPAFYGRILPVLLGLDPSSSANKGTGVYVAHHALKNAFLSCLKCTHPGAAPWRDRLVGALREMKAGGLSEQALEQVNQINGSAEGKDELPTTQEEKPLVKGCDAVHGVFGRKRSEVEDFSDSVEGDDASGKRVRLTPVVSEGSEQDLNRDQNVVPSSGTPTATGDGNNGPVQQLVAMFGALVAQGEKAIGSLEILISSISADLLAEVVMANVRHLPPDCPKSEGDEELLLNMGSLTNDAQFKQLSSILREMLPVSNAPTKMDSLSDTQQSSMNDIESTQGDENTVAALASSSVNIGIDQALVPSPFSSPKQDQSAPENDILALPSEIVDVSNIESEIPGLDSAGYSENLTETINVPSLARANSEETNQEQVTNLGRSSLELVPSMSTDRSEELSQAAVTDVSSINSSTATSIGLSTQLVLPKMSAPVIDLADEEKDQLQELAFTHIVEAYKQVAVAGGSHVRLSLLPDLGVDFPLELDPWKILQKHILSDYMNHEGQELTLRVLYRLFGEAEEERDLFSSTAATSAYEMFLLSVAEALRDAFPASDKSLSRLLGEVPYLPQSIFKLLECLCSPGSSDKDEKELASGDRVTQGLSAVWSLILLRPPIRNVCLKIALQSAVHHLEEVRMKAIRLVANKLYPLSSIAQQIEDFAKEMLYSVSSGDVTMDGVDGDRSELQKDSNSDKPSKEQQSVDAITKDTSSDTSQSYISQNTSEAQRCMSLYFALCTKKHYLFREVFIVYERTSDAVKQAIHRQIPILVRTIGSSPELLGIISDPPTGSENLLMHVLRTLTDGAIPSPELIATIRKLYDSKVKDVEVLIPILSYLPKDEVMLIFPHLVNLPLDKFQAALARVLQGSSHSVQVLSPAEVLIGIHGIDPDRDGIPLKKVTDACNACFEQRQIFTQQVIAKVLNQLVEQIPLPLLFMRTVLQAIGAFPALVEFIMEILSRLVNKQIWKYPKLWVGFLKCAQLTKPQSFNVLLQLPPAQLENALNRTAALKAPLIAHANQPNIRSSLPRSVLAVLGIVCDSNSSQAQVTPPHTGDTTNSDKEAVTEKSKETSGAS